MSDGNNTDDDPSRPLTPAERKILRDMLDNYAHSRWLFLFTMKVAKWLAAIAAGIIAYKQLPGLLK
jgi:hypothetical protein